MLLLFDRVLECVVGRLVGRLEGITAVRWLLEWSVVLDGGEHRRAQRKALETLDDRKM